MDNLYQDLKPGTLLRVTLPLPNGRKTLDAAVEEGQDNLVIRLQKPEEDQKLAPDDQDWVLTQDQGERIILYKARLNRQIGPRRFDLALTERTVHKSTRKSCRIQARVRIREWAGHSTWSRLRRAESREVILSTSGIAFQTDDIFHPGQKVSLEITLPGQALRPVQVTGQVIRAIPKGIDRQEIAVAFINLSREDADIIETFFIKEQFRTMTDRVRLLAEALTPSLDDSEKDKDVSPKDMGKKDR
ncbi:MAG: hypothetical protein D6794_06375 [Deltaproteobacteria bacterium]|nr:MAG: hypothetical protein D6794_06375 [Deltaproteobacteria bacterium]